VSEKSITQQQAGLVRGAKQAVGTPPIPLGPVPVTNYKRSHKCLARITKQPSWSMPRKLAS
jgi:hypothetical protein